MRVLSAEQTINLRIWPLSHARAFHFEQNKRAHPRSPLQDAPVYIYEGTILSVLQSTADRQNSSLADTGDASIVRDQPFFRNN